MTIGELADQKQQRNRTVVIDVAVCHKYLSKISKITFLFRLIHHH